MWVGQGLRQRIMRHRMVRSNRVFQPARIWRKGKSGAAADRTDCLMRLGIAIAFRCDSYSTAKLAAAHDSLNQVVFFRQKKSRGILRLRQPAGQPASQPCQARFFVLTLPQPNLSHRLSLTRLNVPVAPLPSHPPVTDQTTHTRLLKWRPHHPPSPGSCCPSPGASGGGQTSASTTAANFQTLTCA